MSLVERVRGLRPVVLVSASGGSAVSSVGSVASSGTVSVVPGLGNEALRLVQAEVLVSGVPDFTGDRGFSLMVWVRCQPGIGSRRVVGRENGETRVFIEINQQGQPVATITSAVGGYTTALTSPSRVDDGSWHMLVLRSSPQQLLGVDLGGTNLSLWVDGAQVRKGWIQPGLFGRWPDLSLSTGLVLGRSASGGSALDGDVGLVAGFSSVLSDTVLRSVWGEKPVDRVASSGWGVCLG